MYQLGFSAATLPTITDKVIPGMNVWRSWPLESVYAFACPDCMPCKVREGSSVVIRAVYIILGMRLAGTTHLTCIYPSESEGAKYWLPVLTDLKNRGVEENLACPHLWPDGLPGSQWHKAALIGLWKQPYITIQTGVTVKNITFL
jgi:putative transposase